MKTYTFIEEHDTILNETVYFTRCDDMIVSGTMKMDKNLAFEIFQKLTTGVDRMQEKVLYTIKTP